jgi:hypothetical protein
MRAPRLVLVFFASSAVAVPVASGAPSPLPTRIGLTAESSQLVVSRMLHDGQQLAVAVAGQPPVTLRLRTVRGTQRAVLELRRRGHTLRTHTVQGFLFTGGSWIFPGSWLARGAAGSLVVTLFPQGEHAFQNFRITGRTFASVQIWRTIGALRRSDVSPGAKPFALDGTSFSLTRVYLDRSTATVKALVRMSGGHFEGVEADVPLGVSFPVLSPDTKQLFVITARSTPRAGQVGTPRSTDLEVS